MARKGKVDQTERSHIERALQSLGVDSLTSYHLIDDLRAEGFDGQEIVSLMEEWIQDAPRHAQMKPSKIVQMYKSPRALITLLALGK